MHRKYLLIVVLLCGMSGTVNSQSIDTYANQFLFNAFKEQPDTAVREFLHLYIPSLYQKNSSAPEASPANGAHSFEVHSFVFTKHPHISLPFTSGKLEFYCQRYSPPKGVQVYDVKMWLEFDVLEDAEMSFSKLIEMFLTASTAHKISSANGYQKAEFSDKKNTTGFNKIQFRLTADNLDHNRFKILFETTNELSDK